MLGEVLTAAVTPFDSRGAIDVRKFIELCSFLVDNGSDGVVVAGTTGESPTLTDEERLTLFAAAVDAVEMMTSTYLSLIDQWRSASEP